MRHHTILSATLLLALSAACPACSDDATATDASTVTDTPVTDTPVTDTPVTDTPAADVITQDASADRPDVTAPADAAADVVAQDASTDRPDVTAPADAAADVVAQDVVTADTGCAPLAANLTANGMRCTPSGSECPAGYACTVTSGVVASYACEIRCRMDCECPSGSVCGTFTDKAGSRRRCE